LEGGASGSNDQLFTWLCNAPLVPLNFGTAPEESQSGAQTLETGFGKTTCPAGQDTPPQFPLPSAYFPELNPQTLNLKAPPWLENEGQQATAAFINENWAEGEYYGVGGVAALQNAAGNFVTPTTTSLDAAVQVAKKNADGTLTPNYSSTNPDAYPMPDVIYAAVSTNPASASQGTAEANMLTQLLALTGTGGSNVSHLPAGFVPMPASLVTQAQADIKQVFETAAPAPGHKGGGSGSGGGGGTSGSGGFGSTGSSDSGLFGSGGLLGGLLGGVGANTEPAFDATSPLARALLNSLPKGYGVGGPHMPSGSLLGPALPAYALAANQGNTILTLASILGLIALLSGLVMMSSAVLARIRAARAAASAGGGGGSPKVPAGTAPT
jgi:hypothetical protein